MLIDREDLDTTETSRRLVVLLAVERPTPADVASVIRHVRAAGDRLTATLARHVLRSTILVAPPTNPMLNSGSMMSTSDFDAAVIVDINEDANDDDVIAALTGFDRRHANRPGDVNLDLDRSTALLGRYHHLRGTLPDRSSLTVMVALRPVAGVTSADFRTRWLALGRINARNHPTCTVYGQLHTDELATARALTCSGLSGGIYSGLAIESFPDVSALHEGHRYAQHPRSMDGSALTSAHLMEALGEVLDFGSAGKLLAVDIERATSPT